MNDNPQVEATLPSETKGSSRKIVKIVAAVFIAVLGLLGVILLFIFIGYQRVEQDRKNLLQVALSMQNHESTLMHLPAAIHHNNKGEKVWSWRVSILEFLSDKRAQTFNCYDMNAKPWNDPSNAALSGPTPKPLQSVRARNRDENQANVFVVSAPSNPSHSIQGPLRRTLFLDSINGSSHRPKSFECRDGKGQTLMLIQFTRHSVDWASPTTLSPEDAYACLQREPGGCLVAMVDASIHWLPSSTTKESFFAMLTPSADDGSLINSR